MRRPRTTHALRGAKSTAAWHGFTPKAPESQLSPGCCTLSPCSPQNTSLRTGFVMVGLPSPFLSIGRAILLLPPPGIRMASSDRSHIIGFLSAMLNGTMTTGAASRWRGGKQSPQICTRGIERGWKARVRVLCRHPLGLRNVIVEQLRNQIQHGIQEAGTPQRCGSDLR